MAIIGNDLQISCQTERNIMDNFTQAAYEGESFNFYVEAKKRGKPVRFRVYIREHSVDRTEIVHRSLGYILGYFFSGERDKEVVTRYVGVKILEYRNRQNCSSHASDLNAHSAQKKTSNDTEGISINLEPLASRALEIANNPATNDSTLQAVVEVLPKVKVKYPENQQEWINGIQRCVSPSNPRLTLLIEFEGVVINSESPKGDMKHYFEYADRRTNESVWYTNQPLLQQISIIQALGHEVIILRERHYDYKIIYRLFFESGSEILANNLFSKYSFQEKKHGRKKNFVDVKTEWGKQCLLLAPPGHTQPSNTYFVQASTGFELFPSKRSLSLTVSPEAEPTVPREIIPRSADAWLAMAIGERLPHQCPLLLMTTIQNIIVYDHIPNEKSLHKTEFEYDSKKVSVFFDKAAKFEIIRFMKKGYRVIFFNDSKLSNRQVWDHVLGRLTNGLRDENMIKFKGSTDELKQVASSKARELRMGHKIMFFHSFNGLYVENFHCIQLLKESRFPVIGRRDYRSALSLTQQQSKYGPKTLLDSNPTISIAHWFHRARNQVTSDNLQVVMVLDLDNCLVHSQTAEAQFTVEKIFYDAENDSSNTLFYDPNAFEIVKGVRCRGHRIVVMTQSTYVFPRIQQLFADNGIRLEQVDFHNAHNILEANKGEYLDAQVYSKRAILFDDMIENRPKEAFFSLVSSANTAFSPLGIELVSWLERAHRSVSEDNHQLTLHIDLDGTVLNYEKASGRMCVACDYEDHKKEHRTYFVDDKALKVVSQIQRLGHRVEVVTWGNYSFRSIYRILFEHRIDLKRDCYHNRLSMQQQAFKDKPSYIRRQHWGKNHLLVDDKSENHTDEFLFLQASKLLFPITPLETHRAQALSESIIYPNDTNSWLAQANGLKVSYQPELFLVLFTKNILLFEQCIEGKNMERSVTLSNGKSVFVDSDTEQQVLAFVDNGHRLLLINDSFVNEKALRYIMKKLADKKAHYWMMNSEKEIDWNKINRHLKESRQLKEDNDIRVNMVFHSFKYDRFEHCFTKYLRKESKFPRIAVTSGD